MSEVKDKLITAENLKNSYDDNKRAISALKGDIYGQSYYGIRRRGSEEPTIYHPATSDWVHFSRIGYCILAQVVYLLLGEKILEMPEYFDGTYS